MQTSKATKVSTLSLVNLPNIKVYTLVEQALGSRPIKQFLSNCSTELINANRHWLEEEHLIKDDLLLFSFKSFIVKTPHHTYLIDSCIGNHKNRPHRPEWHLKNDSFFLDSLKRIQISPSDIDYVCCTHLHTDHIGWNTTLVNGQWTPTFPNARYLLSKKEFEFWQQDHFIKPNDSFADSILPIVEQNKVDLIDSNNELNDFVRMLPTPGHTVDHFAVSFGKDKHALIMTGDLIHTPLQLKYPDIGSSIDFNLEQGIRSRTQFLETFVDTDTICCPAHFPNASAGRIKHWGDGFKFSALK